MVRPRIELGPHKLIIESVIHFSDTFSVGGHISKIPNVAFSFWIRWGTVRAVIWVEVGSGRGAAIGSIAKLVDMESMLTFSQTAKLSTQLHVVAILGKENCPLNNFSNKNAHSFSHFYYC